MKDHSPERARRIKMRTRAQGREGRGKDAERGGGWRVITRQSTSSHTREVESGRDFGGGRKRKRRRECVETVDADRVYLAGSKEA